MFASITLKYINAYLIILDYYFFIMYGHLLKTTTTCKYTESYLALKGQRQNDSAIKPHPLLWQ